MNAATPECTPDCLDCLEGRPLQRVMKWTPRGYLPVLGHPHRGPIGTCGPDGPADLRALGNEQPWDNDTRPEDRDLSLTDGPYPHLDYYGQVVS